MEEGIKSIRTLKLKDVHFGNQWFDEVIDHWVYEDFKSDTRWRNGWISFDCALYLPQNDYIYLGITTFSADIFKAYDRKNQQFVDLGYSHIADPFDAKFHRSLVLGKDGCIYAAIALLHDVDRYRDAPGSAIVKYDPQSGALSKIAIPLPHIYIQSIEIDPEREVLYCLCFPPEMLASYNLRTGEVSELGLISSGYGGMVQGQNLVLDNEGCVWSNWSLTRAWQESPGVGAVRLCKYDPRKERIVFFQKGLPLPDGRRGTARPETFFNFNDGFIYASGGQGSFYRIDPETGDAVFLFTPTPDRPSRLSSLVKAREGVAYGVTGKNGQCELMRVNYQEGTFQKLGLLRDEQGDALWQCHDIVMTPDGLLYLCENDNPYRSSRLWEVAACEQ